jgi:hypothetical protein
MPSHDITRELLQFIRDPFSVTTPTRFIGCSLSIKVATFCSCHVFCKLSEILSLILCFLPEQLNPLVLLQIPRASPILPFLSAYLGRTPSSGHGLLLIYFRMYSCTPFSSPGRFWTCLVPSVRRNSGQYGPVGNCTLWYFRMTIFCLLSWTLHASIHWGS